MIMQNPEMDQQDQSMEDSATMTIEFLRARLLSERSVSRSARQRADELSKRVTELEEQLKVVTIQRKMAQKATVDVLAILDSQGISDGSEDFDLGSDQEIPYESGVGNDSVKEDPRLMSSRGRRHRSDEFSGSALDSSLVPGGSLSWKGHVDSPHSLEKYKTSNVRRRSSFSSVSSSPKHRLGKSCRQIHREARSVVEESRGKPLKIDSQENEVVCSSEGFPNCLDSGSNIRIESKIQDEVETKVKVANDNRDSGYGRENDMEKALELQAQLIGQFEAMEKAQREWEQKFRENNNSTPESCDLGNHSDITEERDDSNAQTPCSARLVTSNSQEAKTEAGDMLLPEEMSKAEPIENIHNSHDDTRGSHNQKSTAFTNSGSPSQKTSHSLLNGKQNYVSSENGNCQPSDRLHQGSHTHGSPQYDKPTSSLQNDVHNGLPQIDASRTKNDQYALVLHGQTQFSGVLESLKQARLSLQQEISRMPLIESGYNGKAIKPSSSLSKSDERYEIPIGSSGLFRLPTDFFC
ncbi:hypothetical protein L6164_007334 [Bauhinia variegata]|uniref:Uncharacterized protein n=1 Tax=Bauhinia variegata TaxID=167791 RepID=A0ACB9PC98_BAUVA|nr:hypothetical protein L6164_007334 [Bauhinia variegata]